MKIWQRVFIMSLLVVALSVPLGGLYIINNQLSAQIDREIRDSSVFHEQCYTELNNKINSVCNVEVDGLQCIKVMPSYKSFETIIQNLIEEKTSSYSGLKVALDDEFVRTNGRYRNVIENNEEMYENGQTKYEILESANEYFLIMCTEQIVWGRNIKVSTSMDVSRVFEEYVNQTVRLRNMTVFIGLFAGFVLLFIIRLTLKPVKQLQNYVHEIADGNYEQIVDVKGSPEIEDLANDVNIMAESIKENVERLAEVAESRRMFIGNMAHEMKTPLTGILGFADILQINPNLTPEQVNEYSGYIYREALRLKGMSGKLLELVSVQDDIVITQEVSLDEVAKEIIETENMVLQKEDINLVSELCEARVNADPDLLKSVFYNLLDNARKVTEKGGSIEFKMQREGDRVVVKVRDYGIGIRQEEIKKILEPFYMVDKSRSRKSGGAGLGLALCNKIVTLHHGTLEIESVVGEGTTMIVTLPLAGEDDN
ncbi:MAG: HAMP domain-containing histidine kinase [Lachnospiraceae bacterium]|nr:HAMP domain-containing histidine kinase [Lachnospiraceae bacterium]